MLARGTALRFPVFSFEFRLVLTHRSCPPRNDDNDGGAKLKIEGENTQCAYVLREVGKGA
jgi:hypothetical protein